MRLFEWPTQERDDRLWKFVEARHALERQGRFSEVLQAHEAAVRLNANYPDALYGQGRSLHGMARLVNAKTGRSIYFKTGLDLLDQAIRCFEHLVRNDRAADAYLMSGRGNTRPARRYAPARCGRRGHRARSCADRPVCAIGWKAAFAPPLVGGISGGGGQLGEPWAWLLDPNHRAPAA